MLTDADALAAGQVNGALVRARAERSRIRVIAGSLLVHTWQFPAAEQAFSLALEDADDALARIAVTGRQCFSLTRQGRLAQCRELAVRTADEAEPRLSSATAEELAAWGGLLLWGAGASARDNRPDEADAMIRLAKAAAVVTGSDFVPPHAPWHQFGPAVVAVAEAESAVIRDRPEKSLAIGLRLAPLAREYPPAPARRRRRPRGCPPVPGSRRGAAGPAAHPAAVAAQQRYAARIVTSIIGKRRSLTPDMRDLADYLSLPL